jgi:cysteine synthase/molybdopterin converting factor small subunit
MATVRIPPTLRSEVAGARQVEANGATVAEILADLTASYPSLGKQLLEGDEIAPFVNVYVNNEDVRTLDGLATTVSEDSTVILLPAMAGGDVNVATPVLASSVLDLIGGTPLVELSGLSPKESVRIFAKLEGQNPSGSIKDRVAKNMIETAEAAGELEPGRELLEPTSGNTGIALAMVAKVKGYSLTCVMPENATAERIRLLEIYGAKLVFSPAAEGSNGAVRKALDLAENDPRYFMPFQYANAANPRAHYNGTGAEIAEALPRVDMLVAGLGTGGTLMGCGERLRESFPDIQICAAEPMHGEDVAGLRSLDDGYVPPILNVAKLDRKILVSNTDAVRSLHDLLNREGIFGGVSSGAVLAVARKLAMELDSGTIVTVLADGGWKYLSAEFWTQPLDEVAGTMEDRVWW